MPNVKQGGLKLASTVLVGFAGISRAENAEDVVRYPVGHPPQGIRACLRCLEKGLGLHSGYMWVTATSEFRPFLS